MRTEIARKVVHSTLVFFCIGISYFLPLPFQAGVLVLLFFFFLFLRLFALHTPLHSVSRVSYGELFLPLGIGTSLFVAQASGEYHLALMVLACADPLAALIGKKFGTYRFTFFGETRSFEGSFACFSTVCILFLAWNIPFSTTLYSAILITVLEIISLRGSDNITLPLGTIVVLRLLS